MFLYNVSVTVNVYLHLAFHKFNALLAYVKNVSDGFVVSGKILWEIVDVVDYLVHKSRGSVFFTVLGHKCGNTFDDLFAAPNSRYTEVWESDILCVPELELMAKGEESGVFAVKTTDSRQFFILGHPEYDPDTLAREYFRDVDKGLDIQVPYNYYPDDDPTKKPLLQWRSHSNNLYSNWLNYYVYQVTPYEL